MVVDHFDLFAAVAKHLKLSKAAAELHITQPAVTKQLRILEEKYNATLHRRTQYGIELTPAGRVFLKSVKRILREHGRLIEKLDAVESQNTPTSLVVGGSYSPSAELLPAALSKFKRRHPDTDVFLRTKDRAEVEKMVLRGEVELAIVQAPPSVRSLVAKRYRKEALVFFVCRDHPLARNPKLTLEELTRIPLVIRESQAGGGRSEQVIQEIKDKGYRLTVALRCETPAAVQAAVRQGLGVGILFESTIARELEKGDFVRVNVAGVQLVCQRFIIYRRDKDLSPSGQEFLKFLQQYHS